MDSKLAIAAALAFALGLGAAGSTANASGTCPTIASVSDCNDIITYNADGSISLAVTDPTGYLTEDMMIGVINNTGASIASLDLVGSGLFDMSDADGLQSLLPSAGSDSTGYGGKTSSGEFTSFIISSLDAGTVVFGASGIAAGGSAYFSLEQAPSVMYSASVDGIPLPEPTGIAILGVGVVGLLGLSRRRTSAGSQSDYIVT